MGGVSAPACKTRQTERCQPQHQHHAANSFHPQNFFMIDPHFAPTRASDVQFWKCSFEILDLGNVVSRYVGSAGIMEQVVLVIVLCGIEAVQGIYAGDDGPGKSMSLAQLTDVRLGDLLLPVIGIKDGGAILAAHVRPLPIELRGIVHHGKRDLQYLSVGNLSGVEDDLDRLRMTGGPGAHRLVLSRGPLASRVACDHSLDAANMLVDTLHSPKAAACKHRGLRRPRCFRVIHHGCCDHHGRLRPEERGSPKADTQCPERKHCREPHRRSSFQD